MDTLRLGAPKERKTENKNVLLSLDERDNDPSSFLVYVIAAIPDKILLTLMIVT